MWKYERTKQQENSNSSAFSLCCSQGKVKLPKLQETPPELKNLLDGTDAVSKLYQKNNRIYNHAFAFAIASLGGKIDNRFNQGGGPYVFSVFRETYHQMGYLFPNDGSKVVYSQIYMFDKQLELESRLRFPDNEPLDARIVNLISEMLDGENALVKIYHYVRDRFNSNDIIIPCRLHLIANGGTDGRESADPTNAFEFAALIADDNLADNRDIIVGYKGGGVHRISELHPSYTALHYPLLFPRGEDGFRIDILHRDVSTHTPTKRDKVSPREYYFYRIQQRANEANFK